MRRIAPLLILGSMLSCVTTNAPKPEAPPAVVVAPHDEELKAIGARVKAFAKAAPGGGVAVVVIRPDAGSETGYKQTFFFEGHDGPKDAPNKKSIFYLASVTKIFTSTVLAKFVKEGRVSLDDLAQKYVPSDVTVPSFGGKQITLRDLANHTSGLPSHSDNIANPYHYQERDFYRWLSGAKLDFAPGTKHLYSNVGVGFLGLILAKVAGTRYEQLIMDELDVPLKMPDTRYTFSESQKARIGKFYGLKGGLVKAGCCKSLPALVGGGVLASTIDDMSRLLAFYLGFLNPYKTDFLDVVFNDGFTTKANRFVRLGWYDVPLYKGSSIRMMDKNGGMPGVSTYIAFVRESKTGVVVLLNSKSKAPVLGNDILRILNPETKTGL